MNSQIQSVILILFALSASTVVAQSDAGFNTSSWSDIPQRLLAGSKYSVHDPVNRQIILGSIVLTLASWHWDQSISNRVRAEPPLPDLLNHFGDQYGKWSGYGLLGILGVETLFDYRSETHNFHRLEYAGLTLLYTSTVTGLLKIVVNRQRPNGKNYHSFPSGHTSHSFTVAALVKELYGPGPGTVAYGCAAITALHRIQDGDHYLSDVIFGAGLGIVIARGIALTYSSNELADTRLYFWAGYNRVGLSMKL